MRYQVTITVETSINPDRVAAEIQAALGAWGIDSSNCTATSEIEQAAAAEVARCKQFGQQITKLVDDCVEPDEPHERPASRDITAKYR